MFLHASVLSLYSLTRWDVNYKIFAPAFSGQPFYLAATLLPFWLWLSQPHDTRWPCSVHGNAFGVSMKLFSASHKYKMHRCVMCTLQAATTAVGWFCIFIFVPCTVFILSLSWSTFLFCAFLQFASSVHFTISSAAIAVSPLSSFSLSFHSLLHSPTAPSCCSYSSVAFRSFSVSLSLSLSLSLFLSWPLFRFRCTFQPNKKEKATGGEWRLELVRESATAAWLATKPHELQLPCTASSLANLHCLFA